jgi:hypothetical protein
MLLNCARSQPMLSIDWENKIDQDLLLSPFYSSKGSISLILYYRETDIELHVNDYKTYKVDETNKIK